MADKRKGKPRYSKDGKMVSGGKTHIEGPGVWVTCLKGKERQTIGEVYDLFDLLMEELYPPAPALDTQAEEADDDEDLEKAMERELRAMKRPRKEKKFSSTPTETACRIFISCRAPIDPVRLVHHHLEKVALTGIPHTKHAQRFVPITASCAANIQDITRLARKVFPPVFEDDSGKGYKYRINMSMRCHNKMNRDELITAIAECVPKERSHTVDLVDSEIVILVEVFMTVCGMSVVRDYDRLKKYNVLTLMEETHKRIADQSETQFGEP